LSVASLLAAWSVLAGGCGSTGGSGSLLPGAEASANADLPPAVIEAAQERLARHDYAGPRGAAGREFDEAVRVFQARHNLPVDGKLSQEVLRELTNLAVDLDEAARRGDLALVGRLLDGGPIRTRFMTAAGHRSLPRSVAETPTS
jgi:hypothetical protein